MLFRFLLVGLSGFLIDEGLTGLLVQAGAPFWLARPPAIALAMGFTWWANRHFTYEVESARSAREAIRYAAVAMAMAAGNYLIYLTLVVNGIGPMSAVAIATGCQTLISFHLYRHIVFGKPTPAPETRTIQQTRDSQHDRPDT